MTFDPALRSGAAWLELAAAARVYDLGHPLEPAMPVSPNRPGYRMALLRRRGDMLRADGGSAANEMLILENLDVQRLASDRVFEFVCVCLPLKFVGATGSPVRPIAVVPVPP